MTDSVAITLDLKGLPLAARKLVPVQRRAQRNQFQPRDAVCELPIRIPSLFAATQLQLLVRAEALEIDEWPVASQIDLDLNIPNALVGHNLEHGTSVYAAGTAALWLLKTWLVEQGLSREALDLLGPESVAFRKVTITYLFPFSGEKEAAQLVADIQQTALILDKRTVCFESTNKSVKIPTHSGLLLVYNKTVITHCAPLDGAPTADLAAWGGRVARVEALLNQRFLKKERLTQLADWADAYASGTYERLFQQCVVESLRLELRHNYPRPEVFASLKGKRAEFLQWYLDGNDPRQFSSVVNSKAPASAYYKLHEAILAHDIETNIPWCDHVRLRGHALRHVLVYLGDHNPPAERAPWCFCKANWPALLGWLEQAYEGMLALHESPDQ